MQIKSRAQINFRPRRSVLYLPGSNVRALEKARTLSVDSLIFDLEDAVAPEAKTYARENVMAALNEGGYEQQEVIVRVNGLDSPWGIHDMTAIARLPIDGVLLPKVVIPQEVEDAVDLLDKSGGATSLPVWIMAENPRGILNIDKIAASHPRLTVIVMGTSDLGKEMRVQPTPHRLGLLTPLSLCIMAARAYGLEIIDGVYLNLDDEEGFKQVCIQGRELGFDGKTLIHPKQIHLANQIFKPNNLEIKQAYEMIAAWELARKEGKGMVVMNGYLLEHLHIEEAKRLLALAQAIEDRHEKIQP